MYSSWKNSWHIFFFSRQDYTPFLKGELKIYPWSIFCRTSSVVVHTFLTRISLTPASQTQPNFMCSIVWMEDRLNSFDLSWFEFATGSFKCDAILIKKKSLNSFAISKDSSTSVAPTFIEPMVECFFWPLPAPLPEVSYKCYLDCLYCSQ